MITVHRSVYWLIMAILALTAGAARKSSAEDQKLTPNELIVEHLKSIASPTVLAGIRTRDIMASSTVQILHGAFGVPSGKAQIASDGRKLAMLMSYNNVDYPGEHFAYDGKDVTVGRYIPPGTLSPLAEFLNRFDEIMKEGLLGGALSTGWALQATEEKQPRLKYQKAKLKGRSVHTLEYRPRKGLGNFKIVLFFEPETYHHVKTEYKLTISTGFGVTETYYVLSEDFADFREVDSMMLPHRYTLTYSMEGRAGGTFLAHWLFEAQQWVHNGEIDPRIFKARPNTLPAN